MKKLTRRQQEVLEYIKKYIVLHGYPPTVREIGGDLGLSSPATVHAHLAKLEEKGLIKKQETKNRAIELLVDNEYAKKEDDLVSVPLFGNPIEAIAKPDEYFSLPAYLIPRDKEVFTLLVDGCSMINAGILDGDIVIVQRQNTAYNGQIVVAMNEDNEVTLKRFYKEKDHFRLQPENDTMAPIILNQVFILGIAIGLYRQL